MECLGPDQFAPMSNISYRQLEGQPLPNQALPTAATTESQKGNELYVRNYLTHPSSDDAGQNIGSRQDESRSKRQKYFFKYVIKCHGPPDAKKMSIRH